LGLTNVTVATYENTKIEPARMTKNKPKGSKENRYMITEAGVEYVESMLNAFDAT
jgi:DNA-binding PadR family transcriptional regulator